MKAIAGLAVLLALLPVAPAATRLLVTVVEPKSGVALSGLKADDFAVFDDKTPRPVESAEFVHDTLDIMLLLDASQAGPVVQPVAESFIGQLQPKEQMAVVAYHSSADLIQDFTSSHQLLLRSVAGIKFGNQPLVLDALYAAIDGGFRNSPFRRAILLLTSGLEGYSRTRDRDVIRMARRNGVSIFPAYMEGGDRWLFETLAKETGGAAFNLRDMKKNGSGDPAERVFEALRSHYLLTLRGNLGLGEKLKVEVKDRKVQVSALPLE